MKTITIETKHVPTDCMIGLATVVNNGIAEFARCNQDMNAEAFDDVVYNMYELFDALCDAILAQRGEDPVPTDLLGNRL